MTVSRAKGRIKQQPSRPEAILRDKDEVRRTEETDAEAARSAVAVKRVDGRQMTVTTYLQQTVINSSAEQRLVF